MSSYIRFHQKIRRSLEEYNKNVKKLQSQEMCVLKKHSFIFKEFSIAATIPYWLAEMFDFKENKKDQICSFLSLGNLYGISYIRTATRRDLGKYGGWFLFKAMKEYQRLFPSNSKFWDYTERYANEMVEYLNFYYKESRISSLKMVIKISGNRYSLQKCVVSALCLLSKQASLLPQMEEMIEYFNIALSLRNAAREWEYDYYNNCLTFPLKKLSLLKRKIKGKSIADILFLEGIIEEALNKSIIYFDLALNLAKKFKLILFNLFLEHTLTNMIKTTKELKSIREGK